MAKKSESTKTKKNKSVAAIAAKKKKTEPKTIAKPKAKKNTTVTAKKKSTAAAKKKIATTKPKSTKKVAIAVKKKTATPAKKNNPTTNAKSKKKATEAVKKKSAATKGKSRKTSSKAPTKKATVVKTRKQKPSNRKSKQGNYNIKTGNVVLVKNNEKLEFQPTIGKVTSIRQWSETEVSGGGGSINSNQFGGVHGKIDPIKSKTSRYKEFFIKTNKGIEKAYTYTDIDIPMRTGHRICILDIARNNNTTLAIQANYDLNEYYFLRNVTDITIALKLATDFGRPKIIAILSLIILFGAAYIFPNIFKNDILANSSMYGTYIASGLFFVKENKRLRLWKNIIENGIHEIAQSILK